MQTLRGQKKTSSTDKRSESRYKGVFAIKVSGRDMTGKIFDELAHTLDLSRNGARIGAIHFELEENDRLTVQFRTQKIEYRIAWVKKLAGSKEYQVGLRAIRQDQDPWNLQAHEAAKSKDAVTQEADPSIST
jgi:PilZ domain